MMHGREKSDLVIVAKKPANKANEPTVEASAEANAAEPVERRAGTKGNADQQSTCRAQNRISVEQALERIRKVAREGDTRPRGPNADQLRQWEERTEDGSSARLQAA
jgi:RNA-directed DNA polymerase